MSWSSTTANVLKALVILAAAMSLAACSGFRPVYGEAGASPGRYQFAYADPETDLDRTLISELRLRLGAQSAAPGALRITVRTEQSTTRLTRTGGTRPATARQVMVTGHVEVADADGREIFTGTRSAAATYNTVGQVLADTEAQKEAATRAARALADTVRLSIIGALSRRQ